ncbi:MAG: hypothetical protein IJ083_12955 [Clostridia bacterium]|nr:hypothetical protein [Clostridia bacterium]
MKRTLWISILTLLVVMVLCVAILGGTAEETDNSTVSISASDLIDMLYDPDNAALIGETITVEGYFGGLYNEGTDDAYCYLVVAEPGSCCAESVRFIPDAAVSEYPKSNTLVTLTGTLAKVETDGYSALRILDATLVWE